MMSHWFSREEFACKCGCGFASVDIELHNVLHDVREHFGSPVRINSACRCESHNKSVGGSNGSKHKLGIAADITVDGVEPKKVHSYLCDIYPNSYGIGSYDSFTHIDVRKGKARW